MPDPTLQKQFKSLISIEGVEGVAEGLDGGKPCVVVLVAERTREIVSKIPGYLNGYRVLIKETGELRALTDDKE